MMSTRFTIFLLILLTIGFFAFTWGYFNFEKVSVFVKNGAPIQTTSQITITPSPTPFIAPQLRPNAERLELPVSLENPAIISSSLTYVFEANITEIKNASEGAELITDISGPGIPHFLICTTCEQPTKVVRFEKGQQIDLTILDLKPDQTVRITATYTISNSNKKWSFGRVTIIKSPAPTPIPTP